MNVLILTPDRVGSTLLQRLITIYMAGHQYDKPVINLHELTNGLNINYNTTYGREMLSKPPMWERDKWGYHQSLDEIIDLLESADHYKTSRLALYHIINRQDSLADQLRFYNYVNENFFIISARRENLFEHAISWAISTHSKKLNVYSHIEKLNVFYDIYKNGLTVDQTVLTHHLNRYKDYLKWVENHFQVNSYFNYEKDLKDIESYILNLDIFPNKEKKSWNDIFSIEWNDWNKCHKLISDLGSVEDIASLGYDGNEKNTTEKKLMVIDKLSNNLSLTDQNYLKQHSEKYTNTYKGIQELVQTGTLPTGVPIKLQTLAEKRKIIKNFDQCVETYNIWVEENNLGQKYTDSELKLISNNEVKEWYNDVPKTLLLE